MEFVVVPAVGKAVHNEFPIGNVVGALGKPEGCDRRVVVGDVVRSVETSLEEGRRLFS